MVGMGDRMTRSTSPYKASADRTADTRLCTGDYMTDVTACGISLWCNRRRVG
jgi:hypothetical protein